MPLLCCCLSFHAMPAQCLLEDELAILLLFLRRFPRDVQMSEHRRDRAGKVINLAAISNRFVILPCFSQSFVDSRNFASRRTLPHAFAAQRPPTRIPPVSSEAGSHPSRNHIWHRSCAGEFTLVTVASVRSTCGRRNSTTRPQTSSAGTERRPKACGCCPRCSASVANHPIGGADATGVPGDEERSVTDACSAAYISTLVTSAPFDNSPNRSIPRLRTNEARSCGPNRAYRLPSRLA